MGGNRSQIPTWVELKKKKNHDSVQNKDATK